ncbi:MAG: siderophore-interacting protein [Aquihabitans sp.]
MTLTTVRRPPPDFRRAIVVGCASPTPRLREVTIEGPELVGFEVTEPAASLRLLLPRPDGSGLEIPTWTGNEFLFGDGTRPPIRTLTPLAVDQHSGRITVAVVLHGRGLLARWAEAQPVGDEVAISGPGAGYPIPAADRFLLAGDASAVPALGQVLSALPADATVDVVIELPDGDDHPSITHPGARLHWCVSNHDEPPGSAMVQAVTELDTPPGVRVWAAGEAASVQRLRKLLIGELGLPRSHCVIRGYWKHGRDGAGSSPPASVAGP